MAPVPVWIAALPDEIRVRSRTRSGGARRQTVLVNDISLTEKMLAILARHEVHPDMWRRGDCGNRIYGLALLESHFILDDLRPLNDIGKLSREFWARLSYGESNVGHAYFFRATSFLPVAGEFDVPPNISRTFLMTLPRFRTFKNLS